MATTACQTCCDPTGAYAQFLASFANCANDDPNCAAQAGFECQRDVACTAAKDCRAQCVSDGG
jgi:hypothetical protein